MRTTTIKVYKGNLHNKAILEKNADDNLLMLIKHLSEIIFKGDSKMEWWFSMNADNPSGMIVTTYTNTSSRLVFYWFDNTQIEMYQDSIKSLLKEWVKEDYLEFIADVRPLSNFKKLLEDLGFCYSKKLFTSFNVIPHFTDFEGPKNYILRKPKQDELGEIYDDLIKPLIVEGSPVYLSKNQFLHLGSNTNHIDNWLLCVDENDTMLGFAGSPPIQLTQGFPIVYGPYTEYNVVAKLIISEYISYWKMKNTEKIHIFSSIDIDIETQNLFDMIEMGDQSVERYLKKN